MAFSGIKKHIRLFKRVGCAFNVVVGLFKENGICPGAASLGIHDLCSDVIGAEVTELKLTAGEIFAPDQPVGTGEIPQHDLADRGAVDANLIVLNVEIIDLRSAGCVEFAVFQSI